MFPLPNPKCTSLSIPMILLPPLVPLGNSYTDSKPRLK